MHTHQMGTNDPHGLQAELAGAGWQDRPAPLHSATVRRVTTGGMVIRGTAILSLGGAKGRVETFRQTWWCLVLTEPVVQEVFDLNPDHARLNGCGRRIQTAVTVFLRQLRHE